jgi:hypothetical protein
VMTAVATAFVGFLVPVFVVAITWNVAAAFFGSMIRK